MRRTFCGKGDHLHMGFCSPKSWMMERFEAPSRVWPLPSFKHQLFCIRRFTSQTNPKARINNSLSLVLTPSLTWSWIQSKISRTQCTRKPAVPLVFHPHNQALTEALSRPSGFYKGIFPKSIFNVFFASALYSTTQSDDPSYLWWGLTALFYPLNSLKVAEQVC